MTGQHVGSSLTCTYTVAFRAKLKKDTVIEKQTEAGTGTKTQRIGLTERKRECKIFLRWHAFRRPHNFAIVVVIHTH